MKLFLGNLFILDKNPRSILVTRAQMKFEVCTACIAQDGNSVIFEFFSFILCKAKDLLFSKIKNALVQGFEREAK